MENNSLLLYSSLSLQAAPTLGPFRGWYLRRVTR